MSIDRHGRILQCGQLLPAVCCRVISGIVRVQTEDGFGIWHETQVRKRRWRYGVGLPGRFTATFVAMRSRVAARSPMDGASWSEAEANACERETLILSPRAVGCADCHTNDSRCPPFDPVRQARARKDSARPAPARSSPPSVALCPPVAACSAMSGGSWRGDGGGRVRKRNAHPVPSAGAALPAPCLHALDVGRYVIYERARLWSRGSPLAIRWNDSGAIAEKRRQPPSRCVRALRPVRR